MHARVYTNQDSPAPQHVSSFLDVRQPTLSDVCRTADHTAANSPTRGTLSAVVPSPLHQPLGTAAIAPAFGPSVPQAGIADSTIGAGDVTSEQILANS